MSKNIRSNNRQPVVSSSQSHDDRQNMKNVRISAGGPQLKMDMSAYINEYPNKKLMLINDLDGDVQRWIDAGAEPIPAALPDRKVYKGINDNAPSEWVRFVGGQTKHGDVFYVYGLMIDPDLYDYHKHEPIRKRQEEIGMSLKRGANSSDEDSSLPGGGSVQTYAAGLPDGSGVGYNQIKS